MARQCRRYGVELGERLLRPGDVPERDGAMQSRNRCVCPADQLVVEQQDLQPIRLLPRGGLGVAGGDGRLKLVGTRPPHPRRPDDRRCRLPDRRVVPQATVLLAKGLQRATGIEAGRPAGPVQAHQCQEPEDLRLAGHQLGELRRQPLGIFRQIPALGDVSSA
jgi:hypothetical protein